MAQETVMAGVGRVKQIIGPVVDVAFDGDALPDIYTCLRIDEAERDIHVVVEVVSCGRHHDIHVASVPVELVADVQGPLAIVDLVVGQRDGLVYVR